MSEEELGVSGERLGVSEVWGVVMDQFLPAAFGSSPELVLFIGRSQGEC